MAIYKEDLVDIELSTGVIHRAMLAKTIGYADANADRFGVRVFRDGEPVDLTGSTCKGYFITAGGVTVLLNNGSVSNNVAYVTLTSACYSEEGSFCLAIKLEGGSVTGTVRIVDGVVLNTDTGSYVDPSALLPTIDQLIAEIDAAIATIPPDYSSLAAEVSNMHIKRSDPSKWEIGGIAVGTGANSASSKRLRYATMDPIGNLYRITSGSSYKFALFCYDTNEAFIGYWDGSALNTSEGVTNLWQDSVYMDVLPNTVSKIRIMLKRTDEADVAFTDTVGCVFTYSRDPEIAEDSDAITSMTDTVRDDYMRFGRYGMEELRNGAIDSSGNNTTAANYASNSYRTRGFYPVKNATHIVSEVRQAHETNYFNYVLFYDSTFTFISRTGANKQEITVAAVPSAAAYFRVSLTQITSSTYGSGNITTFVCGPAVKNRDNISASPENKWYVLGDSISAGYYSMTESMAEAAGLELDYVSPVTTPGGETTGAVWDENLDHNYWGYANKWKIKRDLQPAAYPGQGYFRKAANDESGIEVVKNGTFTDAGLITVAWGFNDWHYNKTRGDRTQVVTEMGVAYPSAGFDTTRITNINQAIWYCLGLLIQKAPQAKIVVQTPMNGWAYGGDFASSWSIGYTMSNSGTLANIHDDIVYWAEYYGLQVLEMTYGNSIVNRVNIKDTIIDGSHPSDAAHQQLARHVAMLLGYC